MRVGAFELHEPLPELKEPHAFIMLSPWIDVGRVGSLTLATLEKHFGAAELGSLKTPGLFYDFTRYRPMIHLVEGRRQITVPNTHINWAKRAEGPDLLFFHCLEPHMLGEVYASSLLKVMEKLGAKRYCSLGSMYDSVPHTRPLLISGGASGKELEAELRRNGVFPSGYQGPTTINILASERAPERGIETLSLVVRLPHYVQLEEDYRGHYCLLGLLCLLYGFSIDLSETRQKGEEQYRRVSQAVEANPEVKKIVEALEQNYDARTKEKAEPQGMPRLSPEIERFLREIGGSLDSKQ